MAYTSPTAAEVTTITGLNRSVFGMTEAAFESFINTLVEVAETEVGISSLDLDDAGDARLAQKAVCYFVAADAYLAAAGQKSTGTQAPAAFSAAGEIVKVAKEFRARAQRFLATVTDSAVGTDSAPAPFVLPAVSASTFTPIDSDRTPSERNDLLSEIDDISASDTLNG